MSVVLIGEGLEGALPFPEDTRSEPRRWNAKSWLVVQVLTPLPNVEHGPIVRVDEPIKIGHGNSLTVLVCSMMFALLTDQSFSRKASVTWAKYGCAHWVITRA